MELVREQNVYTGTGIHVSSGQGGDEGTGDNRNGMSEPWLPPARADAGGSARAGAPVHPGRGATLGAPGSGASHRVDPRVRRCHGKTTWAF